MGGNMKREIYAGLSFIIILIILPNAFAIGEGDKLTQQQLDLMNADTVGLQCRNEGITNDFPNRYVYAQASCLSIEKIEGTRPYLIVRNIESVFSKPYSNILLDILTWGLNQTRINYHQITLANFQGYRANCRDSIRQNQTNDINQAINQLNLDQNELN